MDENIWNNSKRGFPFNIPHYVVVGLCIGIPVFMGFLLVDHNKHNLLQTNLITLVTSMLAYFLTDQLILQFKDVLASKGLFGIDLNKAGAKEDKPKVYVNF